MDRLSNRQAVLYLGAKMARGTKWKDATPEEQRDVVELAVAIADSAKQAIARRLGPPLKALHHTVTGLWKQQFQALTDAIQSWVSPAREIIAEALRPLEQFMRPGTLVGDVVAIYAHNDNQALYRLASSEYFCRRAIFVDQRWYPHLDRAFADRRDKRRWDIAWAELVEPDLFMAIKELKDETPMANLYTELRTSVRSRIERDLLDGQTADDYRRHPMMTWPEEDTLEARRLEGEYQEQLRGLWEQVENRLEIQRILEEFDPQIRAALELYGYGGLTLREVAELMGQKPATLRKQVSRLPTRRKK